MGTTIAGICGGQALDTSPWSDGWSYGPKSFWETNGKFVKEITNRQGSSERATRRRGQRIFIDRALDCDPHHFDHRCHVYSKFLKANGFVIPGAAVGLTTGSCAGVPTVAGVSGRVGN